MSTDAMSDQAEPPAHASAEAHAESPAAHPERLRPRERDALLGGACGDPHALLGAHPGPDGRRIVRVLRPFADAVAVLQEDGEHPLRAEGEGLFSGFVPGRVEDPYRLRVDYGEASLEQIDGYRFLPALGEMDLHLIGEGRHEQLWEALGAHVRTLTAPDGSSATGAGFAVWAPNARGVRVIGDFNYWDGLAHPMRVLGGSGVWELFVPGIGTGHRYKYEILGRDGIWRQKADPLAQQTECPPDTASVLTRSEYTWQDEQWLRARAAADPYAAPQSVYEVHLASWRPGLTYRQLAEQLPSYVNELGFTHVEILPPTEHPFGGSWGYQVSSYFAPTARLGGPDDFRVLVDALHQAGIGVIVDWVPAHFPKDAWALAQFDGTSLYEHPDPWRGEHPDWGTLVFDYGRNEVRNFLMASAIYWCEEMHIDGLRVDAVASMLYLDYSREAGAWHPNAYGGRENLEAVSFVQELTATVYKRVPGVMMIAEESTSWPGVTLATDRYSDGSSFSGLGFGFKWNLGWMHDTLDYLAEEPFNRRYHHHQMTFSLMYAYSENFVLPLSHDEVVHGKGSLLRKMPGDRWQQLANLRALFAYMWAHPGKKLLFSGGEFGQDAEWSEQRGLDWWLLDNPGHRGVFRTVQDLNAAYRARPALWEQDFAGGGFTWLSADDAEHNVFAFVRWSADGRPLVCVANFAGVPWEGYRLPLPWSAEQAGEWVEVLNTDAEQYGGSGVGNFGRVRTVDEAMWNQPAHAVLRLPPLGVLWLEPAPAGEATQHADSAAAVDAAVSQDTATTSQDTGAAAAAAGEPVELEDLSAEY
ncbi:1,4-alpha-glucan branching protein GlgB [Actinospica durhamensis]|nr:1,4-alpha-glucan branching protein GlgB [Actinospica durhamensis]